MLPSVFFFHVSFSIVSEKAEESYIDPLTEQDFISDLFAVNLVQYKYLRKKADQKQYEYPIFIWKRRSRILTTAQRMTNRSRFPTRIRIWQCRHFFSTQRESINSQCIQFEGMLSSLGEMMDYYVEDLKQRYNPFKQREPVCLMPERTAGGF